MQLRPFILGVVLAEIEQKLEGVIADFEIVGIAPFQIMRSLRTLVFILPCHLNISKLSDTRAQQAKVAKEVNCQLKVRAHKPLAYFFQDRFSKANAIQHHSFIIVMTKT